MADSCCIVELKETIQKLNVELKQIIEKLNVELSQSRTKISELDAKVREQEEENTRLTRDLKEMLMKNLLAQFAVFTVAMVIAMGNWTPWTPCSKTCVGLQTRIDAHTGTYETQLCNKDCKAPRNALSSKTHHETTMLSNEPAEDKTQEPDLADEIAPRNGTHHETTMVSNEPDEDKTQEPYLADEIDYYKVLGIVFAITTVLIFVGGFLIGFCLKNRRLQNRIIYIPPTCSHNIPRNSNESNYEALNINSLPEEILVKVFGYLSQNELGQIARVCRRWSELTRRPILWKKVFVHFSSSYESQTTVAEHFVNLLPPCVTHLSLNFIDRWAWYERFNFEEISMKLKEKCPDLEVLILQEVILTDSLPSAIHLCTLYLHKVQILAFHVCEFPKRPRNDKRDGISKIEVLELKFCDDLGRLNKPSFSKLPYLKRLCLKGTCTIDSWLHDDTSFINQLHILDLGYIYISSRTFQAIQNHGHNLSELYLCGTYLDDIDLSFNNSVCSHLKTICLGSCSRVTCEGVISLIQSCPSLLNVYVNENVAEIYAAHPFIVANRCKAGIIKSIHIDHTHNQLLKK